MPSRYRRSVAVVIARVAHLRTAVRVPRHSGLHGKWQAGRYLAVLTVGTVVGALPAAASTRSVAPAPVYRLSAAGHALYEYEALIHEVLGNGPLSLCDQGPTCHEGYLYRGYLSPMAVYQSYTFVFATTGRSTLHLMPPGMRLAPGSFGNYPVPVTLNGRVVACNARATQFLIAYGDTAGDGNMGCLAPSP